MQTTGAALLAADWRSGVRLRMPCRWPAGLSSLLYGTTSTSRNSVNLVLTPDYHRVRNGHAGRGPTPTQAYGSFLRLSLCISMHLSVSPASPLPRSSLLFPVRLRIDSRMPPEWLHLCVSESTPEWLHIALTRDYARLSMTA